MIRRWWMCVALLAFPLASFAQVRPQRPPRPTQRPPTAGQRPNPEQRRQPSSPADTTASDTTVTWLPPDSTLQELLDRQGFTITRYQGDVVTFDAINKTFSIHVEGDSAKRHAQVEREGQRVVTDSSIIYNDQTRSVNVSGRFNIVPGGGQAPIAGTGTAIYNLSEREGRLTNAAVTVEETGQRWFIKSDIGKTALGDSTRGIPPRFYGLGGTLTSCDDSIPDYHFELKEIKRTDKTLVARPAILYIRDIPVAWLPFVFQDIRPGRRSGILPPRLGVSDIVRNNPGYRRHVENVGYYWAMNNYMDAIGWLDWRSSAGADSLDPGWIKLNGEFNYKWLTRFLSGRLASSYQRQRNGQDNLALSWDHQQSLGSNRRFTMNANYVTSTQLQRQNTWNPYQAVATIASKFNYQDKIGPADLQLGGTRTQRPGRDQVDQTLPSLSLRTAPLALASWLVWTPGFAFNENSVLHIDQPGLFSARYIGDANGNLIQVDTLKKNSFDRTMTFDTPLRIFGFDFRQGLAVHDQVNDFPVEETFYPGGDPARQERRVFLRAFRTDIDWNPQFSLPPFFQNRFKLTPTISLSNAQSGPFWVRTELTGGEWVHQTKRLAYGLSAAPTIFGIWPGFGPFQRLRHSLSPTFTYSYAPPTNISREYLAATGQRLETFTGLQQNAVSFGLQQNFEAKVRPGRDTTQGGEGQKLKLLSIDFSPLAYDFERARVTGRKLAGLTSENLHTSLTSDLIPGFNLSLDHSLFRGSTQSDTAEFKPFLTRLSSSFRISQGENPFSVINRLFGRAVADRSPAPQVGARSREEDALARQIASQPVAGQAARGNQFLVPTVRGWDASFNFSTSRTRRPKGGTIIEFDPRVRCEPLKELNPFAYDLCLQTPANDQPITATTAGAPVVVMPAQTNLTSDIKFQLTEKWSAAWNTSYDFERSQFASQNFSLQRDLHDWRAIFAFTHSPNGNFAFNFFISLKPEPELKFDYSRATVRSR